MPDREPDRPPLEVELEPYHDVPDSPLPSPSSSSSHPPPTQPQPKWLSQAPRSRLPSLLTTRTTLTRIFRPRRRLSIRWILCILAITYVAICLIRRQPLLASPLPAYTGPHAVGAIDLEIPLLEPRQLSETAFKSTGEPAFELQSVLFTVYYPVSHAARAAAKPHLWIPRPVSLTAEGYARFAYADNFFVRGVFTFALWAIAGGIQIPAKVDAPLLGGAGDDDNDGAINGNSSSTFPVMVFSHGMASSRTDYTNYLGELASRGHIVAAVEHRDGSCPGSMVKINGRRDRRVTHFRESDLLSTPPMDTPMFKREQLAFREAEILETIRVLASINDGNGNDILSTNSRREGQTLHDWAGRLDMSRLTISGHSYGATGALQALKSTTADSKDGTNDEVVPVGGIILDPGKESGELNADISAPILVVHSDSWSRKHTVFFGRPHFDTVRDLVGEVLNRTGAAWFLTSLGTSHPSVSDAPLLEPLLLSWTTGARMNTKEALGEYVNVSAEYLQFLQTKEPAGLLAEGVTHQEYGKWVGDERKDEFPKEMARLWEVHVSPGAET